VSTLWSNCYSKLLVIKDEIHSKPMICPSDAYSTGWSIIVEYSHPNRCLITSYKEQARNPRYVALELTPQGQPCS
jgi:hypothetical protein